MREQGEVPAPPAPMPGAAPAVFQSKTGKPTKAQILDYWRALQPNHIIPMQPMEADHKGSTYSQDGIRITGTKQFIDGVLSRLKDLVALESQQTKLEVVYRDIDSTNPNNPRPGTFVFYIMAKERTAPTVKTTNAVKPVLGGKPKVPKLKPPKLI